MGCSENAGGVAGYRLVTTGVESQTSVELADGDGDGVLTGTQVFPRFPPGPQPPAGGGAEPITVPDARIVAPDGSTVEQFGPVPLDREEIALAASISFCDNGGEAPAPGAGPDQYGAGGAASDQYGGAGGTSAGLIGATGSPASGVVGGGSAELPETGGASLAAALGVGALLVGAGLLLRRIRP